MAIVVLLRGVNVGGHRTFRPRLLADMLGHLDVANIGAAGTFVVRRPVARASLRAEFASRLPFESEITIVEGRDILRLVNGDPFAGQPSRPDVVRFVSFLRKRPRAGSLEAPHDIPAGGQWLVRILARENRFVLGLYRRDMKVVGYLAKLDELYGVSVTTRNWNTVTAIAEVIEGQGRD